MEPVNEQHARALAKYADEYNREGFDVVVEPDDSELPVFLRGFGPDLIAIGKEKSYVLELKTGERSGRQGKWSALAAAVEGQPGWHLRLVILNREGRTFIDSGDISRDAIIRRLNSVKELIAAGQNEAALLVAWSNFEAAARRKLLTEGVVTKDFSPLPMIKHLVHLGIFSQEDTKQLEEIMQVRNAVAHGFERSTSVRDIDTLRQFAQSLLSAPE